MRATLASLVVALGLSTSGFAAGTVQLAIHDGRVDLTAHGASVSQILDEWSRVGGTRVVNAERLPSAPVTLELSGVPEAQAIDTLLRAAAGFIAVPRQSAQAGASQFARILILATSVAPAASAAPATATFSAPPPAPFMTPPPVRTLPNGATPVMGADGRPIADDQEGAPAPPASYGPNSGPYNANSMPPGFSPPSTPSTAPGGATPPGAPPAMQAPTAAPAAPVGSSTPGTVVKPQPPRRPGGN